MHLHGTSRINEHGNLEIGGCDSVVLAKKFGTPLIVYDEKLIRNQCQIYKTTLEKQKIKHKISYASKAFSSIAMVQLIEEEGLSLDVVSGGELYTALAAKFPPERIQFHGNNKSEEELMMALDAGVGYYVIDNFYEIDTLERLCANRNQSIKVLLRVTPAIKASTHKYIQTGQEDSKFGFDLASGQVEKAIHKTIESKYMEFVGLHMHIGSQILDVDGFKVAINKMAAFIHSIQPEIFIKVLNIGGGFGIRYTDADRAISIEEMLITIIDYVKQEFSVREISLPEIWIEPGRSIVGEAGTTLYTIGSQKEVPGVKNFIAIDGGMSDNIRPALYQAKYEAMLANRGNEDSEVQYTVAGKLCESGDILIENIRLPKVNHGDLLAVSCTGAYSYSMANNYNRILRPAVIFAHEGNANVIIKRESYNDLIRNDVSLVGELLF